MSWSYCLVKTPLGCKIVEVSWKEGKEFKRGGGEGYCNAHSLVPTYYRGKKHALEELKKIFASKKLLKKLSLKTSQSPEQRSLMGQSPEAIKKDIELIVRDLKKHEIFEHNFLFSFPYNLEKETKGDHNSGPDRLVF